MCIWSTWIIWISRVFQFVDQLEISISPFPFPGAQLFLFSVFLVSKYWPRSVVFCLLLLVFPNKSFPLNDVRIVCSSLIFQRFFSQFYPALWFFICISASSLCFSPQLLLTHTNMQLFVACFFLEGAGRKGTPTNYVKLSVNENLIWPLCQLLKSITSRSLINFHLF